jgi:hypothetical protein
MPEAVQLSAHDAAMVAKVDAASAAHNPTAAPAPGAPAAPARPDHIPEKFWDAATGTARVDEMAKAYAELEKARAGTTPPADPSKPPVDPAKAPEGAPAGVDYAALTAEFTEKGALSEASYKLLADKGIPKEVVDSYIANQQVAAQAATQAAVSEAHALAGDAKAYGSMLDWAATNLSTAEQAAFDRAVVADPASRKQAILALKAQYTAARGTAPNLLSGEGAGNGVGAFQSRAEVTAAMRDPRYKTDPAYRADVERRIGAMAVF